MNPLQEHLELTLVKSGSPNLTSGMEGKVRSGFIMSVPFLRVKRLDMTTKRSEVFFTGRNRRRGTLIPGRMFITTQHQTNWIVPFLHASHAPSPPSPPHTNYVPLPPPSPLQTQTYPLTLFNMTLSQVPILHKLGFLAHGTPRSAYTQSRLDSKSCQHLKQVGYTIYSYRLLA